MNKNIFVKYELPLFWQFDIKNSGFSWFTHFCRNFLSRFTELLWLEKRFRHFSAFQRYGREFIIFCNFLNHISVRNLSLYFRSNFDVLVKGRGIKDYILTEQLSLYFILISFLKSTACLLFLNIFDRIDCSQVRLAKDYFDVLTLEDYLTERSCCRQSIPQTGSCLDGYKRPDQFSTARWISCQINTSVTTPFNKKDFNVIWFSEQEIKMGAGGKEVASIEALPDKVNLLKQAPGKMGWFHHLLPIMNIYWELFEMIKTGQHIWDAKTNGFFTRFCWGCSPS